MSDNPLFDKDVYDILVTELGLEDVLEVLNAFLADTSDKVDAMGASLADRLTTRREAHALKSSAATFGFAELSRLARELEKGAETMSESQLLQSLDALKRSFHATAQFAQSHLLRPGLEAA